MSRKKMQGEVSDKRHYVEEELEARIMRKM